MAGQDGFPGAEMVENPPALLCSHPSHTFSPLSYGKIAILKNFLTT